MNHLDEGTIHAWLDGALDATQAREAEAHVAACATCGRLIQAPTKAAIAMRKRVRREVRRMRSLWPL